MKNIKKAGDGNIHCKYGVLTHHSDSKIKGEGNKYYVPKEDKWLHTEEMYGKSYDINNLKKRYFRYYSHLYYQLGYDKMKRDVEEINGIWRDKNTNTFWHPRHNVWLCEEGLAKIYLVQVERIYQSTRCDSDELARIMQNQPHQLLKKADNPPPAFKPDSVIADIGGVYYDVIYSRFYAPYPKEWYTLEDFLEYAGEDDMSAITIPLLGGKPQKLQNAVGVDTELKKYDVPRDNFTLAEREQWREMDKAIRSL